MYFLIKFTSRTIGTPPKKTTIETSPTKATKTTNPYKTPEKRITTKLFNLTKSPMKMNVKELELIIVSEDDLSIPENINVNGILFYIESGHSIAGGTKKMDKFCLQIPVQDPDDYHNDRFGVAVNKEGRIFVKMPRHAAAASDSKGLYKKDYRSGIADGHKEFATRTIAHQRDGRTYELFKIVAIDVPFKATTQYNVKASTTLRSSTWAGEDIYLVDQQFKVVWKTFSDDMEMPVMFLKFSIGMEDSIREIKLSHDNDVIDTLRELSIAARERKSNDYGMSDEYE